MCRDIITIQCSKFFSQVRNEPRTTCQHCTTLLQQISEPKGTMQHVNQQKVMQTTPNSTQKLQEETECIDLQNSYQPNIVQKICKLPSTCFAVSRSFGSGSSICLTRLLALSEIFGHGSLLKSISPRRIACATPCSDSA